MSKAYNPNLARPQNKKQVVDGKLQCSKCKLLKPATTEFFARTKKGPSGLSYRCKLCDKVYYDAVSPTVRAANNRNKHLQRKYKITYEEYVILFEKCGGVCQICDKPEKVVRKASEAYFGLAAYLSVDHDHKTGEVRGLLCRSCNASLGGFKDDVALLARAIEYLRDEI